MTKTVEEGFRIFHKWLTPSDGESKAAKEHRTSIEKCLIANFEMIRFFRSGSFGNGTSICGHSDVDYFASIPTKHLKENSASTLREICKVLDNRFSNTNIYVDSPAIVLPFGEDGSESTEIVPAKFVDRDKGGNHIYEIADGTGGWMRSSPEGHKSYIDEVDKKLGGKVKPLIRFLKAWKYYRNVPISSFYLEMRVAKYASAEIIIIYSWDIRNIFKLLWDNQLASLQDPTGISGYIPACSSEAKKNDALSKLQTALGRADKARDAEKAEKIKDAFDWWDLVFALNFPSYD